MILDLVGPAGRSTDPARREVAAHLDRELLGPWIARFANALEARAKLPLDPALGGQLAALHAAA